MKPLLIIKAGSKIASLQAFDGDYEDWIAHGMAWNPDDVLVVDVRAGECLPPGQEVSGVVITGSGSMVTEQAPWMLVTASWLNRAVGAGLPTLGICFGHQILAWALGGEVDYNPSGIEVGTVDIRLKPGAGADPLFGAFPETFAAQVSHSQSVRTLPPDAVHLASSDLEPHQGFRVGNHAWGLQFHPEFDHRIISHFVEYYRERLARQRRDADGILARLAPAPASHPVLGRFAELVRQSAGCSGAVTGGPAP